MPPEPGDAASGPAAPDPEAFRRLHPGALLLDLADSVRQALVPILFGGAAAWRMDGSPWPVVLGVLVLTAAWLVLRWSTFRYALQPGLLVIREGLLERRQRELPVSRINHVETRDSLFTRLLGIRQLQVQMEGTAAPEATLAGLAPDEAERVARHLEARRQTDPAAAPQTATPLFRADPRSTLLAGATAFNLAVLLGAAWLLDQAMRRLPGEGAADGLRDLVASAVGSAGAAGPLALGALLLAVLLAFAVLNVGLAFIRWFRFTLVRDSGELQVSSGFFTRSTVRIRPQRIQALRAKANPLRRLCGLATLDVVAPRQGGEDDAASGLTTLVPVTRRSSLATWCARLLPWPVPDLDGLHTVAPYHRRQQALLLGSLTLLACAAAALAWGWLLAVPLGLGLAPAAWWLAGRARARTGFQLTHDLLVSRVALISEELWLTPRQRVQGVILYSTPFQRRRGLASVEVDVNGNSRRITVPNIPLPVAEALASGLLESVASAPPLRPASATA